MVKYLYVLTSSGEKDHYYEQFFLSITSLKKVMPNAYVVLLTDDKTEKTLTGKRNGFREMISEFKNVSFPDELTMHARSRWLKTTMRKQVTGNFLYLDCDTIIVDDLSDIEESAEDIGAVLDYHTLISSSCASTQNWCFYSDTVLNFSSSKMTDKRYNGGILYCKDNEIGHEFFEKWHELWLFSISKGIKQDQPSLNQTNYLMNEVIKELSGVWNCQIAGIGAIKYLYNSKIIHYWGANEVNIDYPYLLAKSSIFQYIKETGGISEEISFMLKEPRLQFDNKTCILIKDTFDNVCNELKNSNINTIPLSKIYKIVIKRTILKLLGKNHKLQSVYL